MHDARLVKLFERYRSTGDLVALGRVFDIVGPRLLRVARHVAARPDEAEDLVQATCLAAIEGAARFDATRALEPWLVGILVNQARIGRRRRRAVDLDPLQPSDPHARPEDELEEQELVGAVRTALESLPERYREVLEPHLYQGLRPLEIAERLHRPQGTVRAQLHRGLRLVRSMLPAGFALGAGALFAPRGWAAVRRTVMAEAERRARLHEGPDAGRGALQRAAGVPTTSTGGVLALVLGTAAVAGLCGTLVLFARGGPRDDVPVLDAPLVERDAARSAPVRGEPVGGGRLALAGAASASDPEPARAADAAPELGTLRVTVVDDDGAALAGERVTITPWGAPLADAVDAVSAADGSARFDGVPAGYVGVHVDGSHAQGRALVEAGTTAEFRARGPREVSVTGRVVDERGRGIGGAAVCVARAAADGLARADGFAVAVHSDASGAFALEAPAGAWVAARLDGRAPGDAAWVDGLRGRGAQVLELVLAAGGDPLTGTVVGADGAPLDGARVTVRAADADDELGLAADGSVAVDAPVAVDVRGGAFRVDAVPAGPLRIECTAPGHRTLERVVRLPGEGTRPLALALEPEPVDGERAADRVAETAETIEGIVQGPGGPVGHWLVRAVPEPHPDEAAEGAGADGLPAWLRTLFDEPREALAQAFTDWDGRFLLRSEPGASYVLELRPRGSWRGPPCLRRAGVRSGSRDVRLVLDAEAGAVRIDCGGRDAGLFVAVPEDGGSPVRSRAQAPQIDPLPPGRYRLFRWPVDGPPVDCGAFELGAGEVLELALDRLGPG